MIVGSMRSVSSRAQDLIDGSQGEILEKQTRVLTDEEKAQLEIEFVGKNGQKRKLEVGAELSHLRRLESDG